MTSRQQDPSRRTPLADNMASSRRAQDAILSNHQLLHAIRSSDLGNCLDGCGIVVSAIAADDKERALYALWDGEEDACDEGFGVVRLLEDSDAFAETGSR